MNRDDVPVEAGAQPAIPDSEPEMRRSEPDLASPDTPGPDTPPSGTPAGEMRLVSLVNLVVDLPSVNPVVVLREVDAPWRELRFAIGTAEGVAIAQAWRHVTLPRPMTHEFMTSVLERFSVAVEVVNITGVEGRTFFAEVIFSGPSATTSKVAVPCRPTDALALALRQGLGVPIMVHEDVMAHCGVATVEGVLGLDPAAG